MTYQEYYEKLQNEYAEASSEFLSADREMFETNGFGDSEDIANCAKKKQRWQVATNNYWNFLSYIKGKEIVPTDEFFL